MAKRISKIFALAIAVVGLTALTYLLLLRIFWLPGSRQVELNLAGPPGGLIVYKDVGRRFFVNDSETLRPARRHRFEIPTETLGLRIRLTGAEGTRIDAVAISTSEGAVTLAPGDGWVKKWRPRDLTIRPLPPAASPVPVWLHLLCAALALLIIGVPVALPPLRRRLASVFARAADPAWLFSLPGFITASMAFGAGILLLAECADTYQTLVRPIDNPPYWPISIFDPAHVAGGPVAAAALVVVVLCWALRRFALPSRRHALIAGIGLALVGLTLSNLYYGWQAGFVKPAANNAAYLPDAKEIDSAAAFLSGFVDHQLDLRTHSRTHPPGAVLIYHAMSQLFGDAGVIAWVLGAISIITVMACAYSIAIARLNRDASRFAAVLIGLVPAAQIYFISTVDAAICACFAATVCCFMHSRAWVRHVGASFFLVASLFMTFGTLFLVAVLFLWELWSRRSLRTFAICTVAATAGYFAIYLLTGFNWFDSFQVASRHENPYGFWLFHNPGSYAFTRIEGIVEIALFAGPALVLLWPSSLRSSARTSREIAILSVVGVLVLLLMFVSGSFRTGETARACLFIYPFLGLSLAGLVKDGTLSEQHQFALVASLVLQTNIMQILGNYHW